MAEAADAFGCMPSQKLVKVQLPLALPTIMAGVIQTIMLALRACMFTNTPDEHFLLDRLPDPQVILVSSCSGHGYKLRYGAILGPSSAVPCDPPQSDRRQQPVA